MTPMSKIEQATTPMVTIGSLDAQDSIRYIMDNPEKTEDQAKRNQELINHLMQKIRQMEQHDRSKGEVRRQLFGIFIYSVKCSRMSAIYIGIATIECFLGWSTYGTMCHDGACMQCIDIRRIALGNFHHLRRQEIPIH